MQAKQGRAASSRLRLSTNLWTDMVMPSANPKFKIFIWKSIHNILPVKATLRHKRMQSLGCSPESTDHLFILCEIGCIAWWSPSDLNLKKSNQSRWMDHEYCYQNIPVTRRSLSESALLYGQFDLPTTDQFVRELNLIQLTSCRKLPDCCLVPNRCPPLWQN